MKKISYQDKLVFITTFIIGFLTHGFAIVNKITNHDDMATLIGCGNGIALGRWMWKLWASLNTIINPFVYGLINLLLMSICAVLLIRIFDVKKRWIAVLIGGVWISFPANTSMFFYTQLIPIYTIGIFFSVLAVYIFASQSGWKKYLLSIICIILGTACYQAYFAITFAGLTLLLLLRICGGNLSQKDIIFQVLYTGSVLLIGILGYFAATKIICNYYNIPLVSYQGMDSIGVGYMDKLPQMLSNAYAAFFGFHSGLQDVVLAKIQDAILPLVFFAGGIVLLWKQVRARNILAVIIGVIIIALYPAVCNLTYLYGSDFVYSLMQYSNAFLHIAVLVFLDEFLPLITDSTKYLRVTVSLIGVVISLGIVQNVMLANHEYYAQYRTQIFSFEYLGDVVTRIRSTDGYSPEMPVSLIGYCQDASIKGMDAALKRTNLGGITTADNFINSAIYQDWLRPGLFNYWLGFSGTFLSKEQSMELLKDPRVSQMPDYPADGSVQVVDGIVVVHFSSLF